MGVKIEKFQDARGYQLGMITIANSRTKSIAKDMRILEHVVSEDGERTYSLCFDWLNCPPSFSLTRQDLVALADSIRCLLSDQA
jgi:hypothetical protein